MPGPRALIFQRFGADRAWCFLCFPDLQEVGRNSKMKYMIRHGEIATLGVAYLLFAAFLFLERRPAIAPIELPFQECLSSGIVAQGEALAAAGHCESCHTRPGGHGSAGL